MRLRFRGFLPRAWVLRFRALYDSAVGAVPEPAWIADPEPSISAAPSRGTAAARPLLDLRTLMHRGRPLATLGSMAIMMLSLTSCLVSPYLEVAPVEPNSPPEVVPDSPSPATPFFLADSECNCIEVELTVFDRDNDPLRARVATRTADEPSRTLCVRENVLPSSTDNTRILQASTRFRLVVGEDFVESTPGSTHVVSVFVTDAPSFLSEDVRTGTAADCGRIETELDAQQLPATAVIEHRWTVRFEGPIGKCPGCQDVR